MDWWQGLLLGIVQGLTEFLPISSSGHLALVQQYFNLEISPDEMLSFDIFLHLGTLLALFHFYRTELSALAMLPITSLNTLRATPEVRRAHFTAERDNLRLLLFLVIGTLPAVVVGLTMKKTIEAQFGDLRSIGIQFIITSFILLSILLIGKRHRVQARASAPLTPWRSLLIGSAQAAAILPSISRSGSTIVTGMWLGMSPELATRYSFLLSIPAILGAMILSLADVPSLAILALPAAWWGLLAAAGVGWICLMMFLKIVRQGKLHWFAYYCFMLGLLCLWAVA